MLSSVESSNNAEPVTHYTGLSSEAVASGLKAFTQYSVILKVGRNQLVVDDVCYFHLFIF